MGEMFQGPERITTPLIMIQGGELPPEINNLGSLLGEVKKGTPLLGSLKLDDVHFKNESDSFSFLGRSFLFLLGHFC